MQLSPDCLKIVHGKKEEIVGIEVHPQGDAEWEYFFRRFPMWLSEGNGTIRVSNQMIYFDFQGTPNICFPLNHQDAVELKEILSNLGKKYQGKAGLGGFGNKSLIMSFSSPGKGIKIGFERFGKRALQKSKKSAGRRCIEPKK